MASKRIYYIDILRVTACFLVILTHSGLPSVDGSDGWVKGSISFIGAFAPDLFFVLSGALLLPVHTPMKEFYKRRFLKLLPPVACWSVILLVVHTCMGKCSFYEAFYSLVQIPIRPVTSIYWFIYVMVGLYLLAPILSKWVEGASQQQLQFFLLLWVVNLILPYLNLLSPNYFSLTGSHYWMLNYFGGFVGYFLLGYYLHRYPIRMGWNREWLIVLLGVIIYICGLAVLKMHHFDVAIYINNVQIGRAFLVTACIIVAQRLSTYSWTMKMQNIINPLAKYSFGIYLIHPMIVRDLVWSFFVHHRMPALPETFAIAIISMLLSYGVLRMLSCLPKSKYIVGC